MILRFCAYYILQVPSNSIYKPSIGEKRCAVIHLTEHFLLSCANNNELEVIIDWSFTKRGHRQASDIAKGGIWPIQTENYAGLRSLASDDG